MAEPPKGGVFWPRRCRTTPAVSEEQASDGAEAARQAGLLRLSLLDQGGPLTRPARRGDRTAAPLLSTAPLRDGPAARAAKPAKRTPSRAETAGQPAASQHGTQRASTPPRRPRPGPARQGRRTSRPASRLPRSRWPGPRGWGNRLPRLYPPVRPGARVGQGQGATRAKQGQAAKPARVAGPAYGPLTMPDPNPNRTPAKPAPAGCSVTRASVERDETPRAVFCPEPSASGIIAAWPP